MTQWTQELEEFAIWTCALNAQVQQLVVEVELLTPEVVVEQFEARGASLPDMGRQARSCKAQSKAIIKLIKVIKELKIPSNSTP